MTNDDLNPADPAEIIKEIFSGNQEITDNFSKHFSKEILEFSEAFSEAYKKFLEMEHIIKGRKNVQIAFTSGLIYLTIDSLFTSVKLFVMGYQIPSGNLMRQVIEGLALTCLISLKNPIIINSPKKRKRIKRIHFFTSFEKGEPQAEAHKAFNYLLLNAKSLKINQVTINALERLRKLYNKLSHPTELGLATTLNFGIPGRKFMGGGFDEEKMDIYKKELNNRTNICKILPQVFDWLIINVKNLS